mmetsp:Transcript_34226/g.111487  ORF Transcript_34226/g.111487 Transcript_34226/m.111487 type:complete len:217 (-) Transcript_34226:584-1234(-)
MPSLLKPTDFPRIMWPGQSSSSCSSKEARGDRRAVRFVWGLKSINNRLFISSCNSRAGRSFTSSPNGFSNSVAIEFNDHKKKTCIKETTAAQNADFTHMQVKNGVAIKWNSSNNSMHCTYGKGIGTAASFLASWYRSMPLESSWKARDKIGGATLKIFRLSLSTISCMIQWKISSAFSVTSLIISRLCRSMPSASISSSSKARTLVEPDPWLPLSE